MNRAPGARRSLFGSSPSKPLPSWARHAIHALSAYLFLMLLVRWASPDPVFQRFPDSCPVNLPIGCARVAELNSQRNDPLGGAKGGEEGRLQPLRLSTRLADAHAAVAKWIDSYGRAAILYDTTDATSGTHRTA